MTDSQVDWRSLCESADKGMNDEVVTYEFSDGRKFVKRPEDDVVTED